ncbi:MAG: hypothetical protein CMJ37_02180 [Phycisphaerae bacterium]|nr:hypothetical protein [Phycisphaerae bacterium]
MSDCDSQFVVLAGAAEAIRQIGGELRQSGIAPRATATHLTALRQGLILQPPSFVVICVALSEKSTKRHDHDLKIFLDDMRSLPGTVRSIGVTPNSVPGLTGQLASLGFDLYLNDPLQAASAIESIRMETSKAGSSRFDALCEIELEDSNWPVRWGTHPAADTKGTLGVERFNFDHD